jgi:hypothetical protein
VLYYVALALLAVCIVIPVEGLRPSSMPGQRATWRFSAIFGLLIGALWYAGAGMSVCGETLDAGTTGSEDGADTADSGTRRKNER